MPLANRSTPANGDERAQVLPLLDAVAGVPQDERAKIVGQNAARLYRFDVARLAQTS